MKIVFTSRGTEWGSKIDPRFGRTPYLLVLDEEQEKLASVDNGAIAEQAHGAGPRTAQKLVELGGNILITGNGPGGNAAAVLEATGVEIYVGAGEMTVEDALEAYRSGGLQRFRLS